MRSLAVACLLGALVIGTFASASRVASREPSVQTIEAPRIQPEQEPDRRLKDQEAPRGPKAGPGQAPAPVPKPAATDQHGESGTKAEQGGEQGTEFWPPFLGHRLKVTDSIVAVFTAMLAAFTYLLWRSTDKLWKAGERQIAVAMKAATAAEASAQAALATQRPWIGLVEARVAARIEFQGSNGELVFDCSIKNFGQSVATGIDWHFECEAVAPGQDPNWPERQALALDRITERVAGDRHAGLFSLVPHQELMIRAFRCGFRVEGLSSYVIMITGGLRYLIDGMPHWTGVVFTVVDHAAGEGEGIPVAHGPRDVSQVKVVRAMTGGRVT